MVQTLMPAGLVQGSSPSAAVARTAWWVEPVFVADIEYREISGDGLLRHPSFRGIRTDKTPNEVGPPS
ncbi:ATP dependent DNA ligase [Nocardia salmonicida]|uniref:ATP dependent DNA ligase n=2 Tax=Nocardia salmonicida TaxID=53431 RepID=UPI002E2D3C42|nr:hypothetical protein [Nocardia salmonicida]